jgi:uncharacterized protein (UPF0332 family)
MGYSHAARAILYRDGIREKSHYCIGVYLESYREKGLLKDEWVSRFNHMRGLRQNDQYALDARRLFRKSGRPWQMPGNSSTG